MPNKITHFLFDLDKTLISTKIYSDLYPALIKTIKQKFDLTENEINDKAESAKLKKNKEGVWDSGELSKTFNILESYYELLESRFKVVPVLLPYVKPVLKKLKQENKIIAIVSNSMTETIKMCIHETGISEFVDFTFSPDNTKYAKEDVEFWKALIKKHNLNPNNCLMIGDDPVNDIAIPKSVGFNTFHISSPDILKEVLDLI